MNSIRFIRWVFVFLLPITLSGQAKFEVLEFLGKVKAIEPGFKFALERLTLDVNGNEEKFIFNPQYGKLIFDQVKVGDNISLKANVNIRDRDRAKQLTYSNSRRVLSWYFFRDEIKEIKVRDKIIQLPEIKREDEQVQYRAFLDKNLAGEFIDNGYRTGLIFENGLVAYNRGLGYVSSDMEALKITDKVSFAGTKIPYQEGFKYPIEGVNEVYHYISLKNETGTVKAFLFKQNFTCIGAKFDLTNGNSLSVSFPSDQAAKIKEFLNPKEETKIYYHNYKVEGQLHPPELQALIQGTDTLYVGVFGFYGDADGKHEHTEIEFEGKIMRVNTTEKGTIISLIVGPDYYVEVEPLMAKQLMYQFKRGTELKIIGQERIKKKGEIYQKEYRIITPVKIIINGKEFSRFIQ
jgi:hypothetical protein